MKKWKGFVQGFHWHRKERKTRKWKKKERKNKVLGEHGWKEKGIDKKKKDRKIMMAIEWSSYINIHCYSKRKVEKMRDKIKY